MPAQPTPTPPVVHVPVKYFRVAPVRRQVFMKARRPKVPALPTLAAGDAFAGVGGKWGPADTPGTGRRRPPPRRRVEKETFGPALPTPPVPPDFLCVAPGEKGRVPVPSQQVVHADWTAAQADELLPVSPPTARASRYPVPACSPSQTPRGDGVQAWPPQAPPKDSPRQRGPAPRAIGALSPSTDIIENAPANLASDEPTQSQTLSSCVALALGESPPGALTASDTGGLEGLRVDEWRSACSIDTTCDPQAAPPQRPGARERFRARQPERLQSPRNKAKRLASDAENPRSPVLVATTQNYQDFLRGVRGFSFAVPMPQPEIPNDQLLLSASGVATTLQPDSQRRSIASTCVSVAQRRSIASTCVSVAQRPRSESLSNDQALVAALDPDPPQDVSTGRLPSLSVKAQKSLVMFSKVHALRLHSPAGGGPELLLRMDPNVIKVAFLTLCDERGRLRPRQLPEVFSLVGLAPYSKIPKNGDYTRLVAPLLARSGDVAVTYTAFKQTLSPFLVWDPLDVLAYLLCQLRKGHLYSATSVVTKGEIMAMLEAFHDAATTFRTTRPAVAARHRDLLHCEAALAELIQSLEESFTFVGRMPLEDFIACMRSHPILRPIIDPPGFLASVAADVTLPPAIVSHLCSTIETLTNERLPEKVETSVPTALRWPPNWPTHTETPAAAPEKAENGAKRAKPVRSPQKREKNPKPSALSPVPTESAAAAPPFQTNQPKPRRNVSLSERTAMQEALSSFERAGGHAGPYVGIAALLRVPYDVSRVNFTG